MSHLFIITAYLKDFAYLPYCLRTIPKEASKVIIADGLASNKTYLALKTKLQSEIANIDFIDTSQNVGLSNARNLGLAYAEKKESIANISFLDVDDIVMPSFLYHCSSKSIAHNQIFFGKSCLQTANHDLNQFYDSDIFDYLIQRYGKDSFVGPLTSKERFLPLLLEPQMGTKIFGVSVVKDLRFPSNLLYEDTLFNLQAVIKADSVCIIDEFAHSYNNMQSQSRITSSKSNKIDIGKNINLIVLMLDYLRSSGVISSSEVSLVSEIISIKMSRMVRWSLVSSTLSIGRANIQSLSKLIDYFSVSLDFPELVQLADIALFDEDIKFLKDLQVGDFTNYSKSYHLQNQSL